MWASSRWIGPYQQAFQVSRLSHENIVTVHELFEQDGRTYLVMELLEGQDLVKAVRSGYLRSLERKIWRCAGCAKLVDFGIARMSGTAITKTNTWIGTANYMSPEQWTCEEVDHRADIFSLGVVLYELLTGQKPFEGHSPAPSAYQVTTKDPTPVNELNPAIPERLGGIVGQSHGEGTS